MDEAQRLDAPVATSRAAKDFVRGALEEVPHIAPGWEKYFLEAQYKSWVATLGEPPRYPDRAFLGWVKKFTKGKRP